MANYSNYPSTTPETTNTENKKSDSRNIIYAILIVALLGTWAYIIYDKNKTSMALNSKNEEIVKLDSAKSELQDMYHAAL
ncbi:MAG: hypothetical protein ABUT20_52950, partial [Bacteroidota bacterium]